MIPKEELRRMYWDEGMSMADIGREVGVYPGTVCTWMKKCCIESRTNSESLVGKFVGIPVLSEEELQQMYWDEGMSMNEIAKEIGVSQATVHRWMKTYRIEARTYSEALLGNLVKPSKEELEKMYWDRVMSTTEIAKLIGVLQPTVYIWMKEYKIKTRTVSESLTGKNSPNWQGGTSLEPYCNKFNNKFKDAVRERDDYTCQICGHEQLFDGQRLDVHHIHYDKENCYPDVVALCRSCHTKTTSGDRDYWEQYFEDLLIERGLFNWSMGVS